MYPKEIQNNCYPIARCFLIFALLTFYLIGLSACKQSIQYLPKIPNNSIQKVSYHSVVSTKLGDDEMPGTQFAIEYIESQEKANGLTTYMRKPLSESRKGFNKDLLLDRFWGKPFSYISNGQTILAFPLLDSTTALLSARTPLSLKWRWDERTDTSWLKDWEGDRLILASTILPGEYGWPVKQSIDGIAKLLKTIKIDSLIFEGVQKRNQHKCIEYTVHYQRKDSLDIYIEQLFASFDTRLKFNQYVTSGLYKKDQSKGRMIDNMLLPKGDFSGKWHFSKDVNTGLFCQETISETINTDLTEPIRLEKIQVGVYRWIEKIYQPYDSTVSKK